MLWAFAFSLVIISTTAWSQIIWLSI
jgi:hypothetical protein